MNKPSILVTIPRGPVFDTFFDETHIRELERIAHVEWNETGRQFTSTELRDSLRGKKICVTGWGTPNLDETVLEGADTLELMAHTGGSVRPYMTDAAYEKGIRACSGNKVFARSVAEGVVAYALAELRQIPRYSQDLKKGIWPSSFYNRGLLDRTVGIVGYGMIAGYVVDMLKVFHTPIKVFSNHIQEDELRRKGMEKASLAEIFSSCDIVSIHTGMTAANHHLITEELLHSMKDGAVLINTARGAIIDEPALCRVLRKGRISAVLDVYEQEPLPGDSPLLQCENALLMPHMGGPTIDRRKAVTLSLLEDIRRYLKGDAMDCEIAYEYAKKMSTI